MPNEYGDPVHPSAIELAVALTIELGAQDEKLPGDELARRAVDTVFCTCVTTVADAVANGEAPVHAGLITEIREQAQKHARHRSLDAASDVIDRASEQSFPASDAPTWIWR